MFFVFGYLEELKTSAITAHEFRVDALERYAGTLEDIGAQFAADILKDEPATATRASIETTLPSKEVALRLGTKKPSQNVQQIAYRQALEDIEYSKLRLATQGDQARIITPAYSAQNVTPMRVLLISVIAGILGFIAAGIWAVRRPIT